MKRILNSLKLAVKINITTILSIISIVILAFGVYIASVKVTATTTENTKTITFMHQLTYRVQKHLDDMNYITIQNAIKENKSYTKQSDLLKKQLSNDLKQLKNSKNLRSDKLAQKIIYNITQRVIGYRLIANELRNDIQSNNEDGLYSILALSSASKKISTELELLDKKILKISQNKIQALHQKLFHIRIAVLLFLLSIAALLLYINKSIVDSILQRMEQLKEEVLSFFDLLSQKRDTVRHITIDGNDEIAEILKIIDNNMYVGEKIIAQERDQAKEIKQKVNEGLKEITQLNNEIEATQREIVFMMGTIAEERSKETGQHVQRVAEYSLILARLYGLSLEESILIKNASPMHDIGKVGIPDTILNKPGKFTNEEFEIMKNHTKIGYRMLKHSTKSILKAAAILAYQHHERWDGKGYPQGLKGEDIHIYGRITAIADVFDALGSERIYKKAWPLTKILQLFQEERGKQFDPLLVDLFLDNLEHFLAAKENIESNNNESSLSKYIENFEKVPNILEA